MKRPWHLHSIRGRLTLWYTLALTVVLLLYAGSVFLFLRYNLFAELDRQLREDFEVAEQMLERTGEGGVRWHADPHHEENEYPDNNQWFEVWSPEGKLLYRSPSPREEPGPISAFELQGHFVVRSIKLPNRIHIRFLSGSYLLNGLPVIIRVARSEEPLRQELKKFLLVLVLGLPLAIGIAGLGGYILARRALEPIGRITEQARRITAENLRERLPVENPEDELGHLARVFNEAFARLERSFEQMRRFTADASHELRTPLTAIRSVGEVGLREPRDAKAYREVIGSMLEEVDSLSRLVDNLLILSRADAGHVKLTPERVDLVELAQEVVNQLGVLAEEKQQSISIEATGPVYIWGDRMVLRQAIINLVDNAIKYSPEGACIRIVVQKRLEGSVLEVIDRGPGIAPEHRERIFDRFYRIDKARSRELGGTGLGLSIARWAIEAHGGRIELESEEGRGSTFRIVLPALKNMQNSQPSPDR